MNILAAILGFLRESLSFWKWKTNRSDEIKEKQAQCDAANEYEKNRKDIATFRANSK